MRIAIDMSMAENGIGGLRFAGFALLAGLARNKEDARNDYYILTSQPTHYRILPPSEHMHLHRVRWLLRDALIAQHQLLMPRVLRRLKPDVLHVPAFVAPLGWDGPLVITVHDLRFMDPAFKHHYPAHIRLYWQHLLHESVRRAQRIIVVSERTRAELKAHWDVKDERMTVIHNAVRPWLPYGSVTVEQREEMQQRYAGRYLLHVGPAAQHKNLEALLDAFTLLAAQDATLQLVLTGGSEQDYPAVVERIASSPFKERIHAVGWVTDKELGVLYAGASALVFPSHHEGFGLPSLEAMAFGVPVVASPEAASPEVVESAALRVDCNNAELLADAIHRVLTDAELREHMIELGYEQARRFSVEGCAEATCAVYEQVAALTVRRRGNERGVGKS
jgi:glycosyltransferase involved in cell wall biosynthesis